MLYSDSDEIPCMLGAVEYYRKCFVYLLHISGLCTTFQFLADHVQSIPIIQQSVECQHQVVESLIHHMLPERKPTLMSPRKSTTGHLFAIGGMDTAKGKGCDTVIIATVNYVMPQK